MRLSPMRRKSETTLARAFHRAPSWCSPPPMASTGGRAEFGKWWESVLARDEVVRRSGETVDDALRRILRCVFCNADLEPKIRAALAGDERRSAAMLAYWDDDGVIFATGLYCQGDTNCLGAAKRIGYLRDVHAEYFCGPNALPQMAGRILDNEHWDVAALRRYTLACAALGTLPKPVWRVP
jgi:hypothetical protein